MAPPPQPLRELSHLPLVELADDETFRLRQPGDVASLAQSIAQIGQLSPIEVRELGGAIQPITGFRRLQALRLLHRDRVLVRNHGPIADGVAALIAAADSIDSRSLDLEELREMQARYETMGWGSRALQELIGRAIERAEERLEDLSFILRGEEPPDRTVVDEDGDEDDDAVPSHAAVGSNARGADAASSDDGPFGVASAAATTAALDLAPIRPPMEPPHPAPLGQIVMALAPVEMTAGGLAQELSEQLSAITQDLASLVDHWSEVPPELRGILADQLDYYSRLGSWLSRASGDRK